MNPKRRSEKIGLFGGSFDPIHLGHLLFAQTALEQLKLDRIVFVPAQTPPHKVRKKMTEGAVRLDLIRRAIRSNPRFSVSPIELNRSGKSYTLDTLEQLSKRYATAKWTLLMGRDLLSVPWKGWEKIKQLAQVVILDRDQNSYADKKQSSSLSLEGVRYLSMPSIEISSSQIRKRVGAGKSIQYWVPSAVVKRIDDLGLYQKERR